MSKWLRSSIVGIGAVVLSTVAIQASDEWRGVGSSLTSLLGVSSSLCDAGAVPLQLGQQTVCVDQFEASPAPGCPETVTNSHLDTVANLSASDCSAISQPDMLPWRFVSLSEAQQLCARSGKRLPTVAEWYRFALLLPEPEQCVIAATESKQTNSKSECTTPQGIADLVGNVWEWTDEVVTNGEYHGRQLPPSGYVEVVDNNGIVTRTTTTPLAIMGADYANTAADGVYGVLRGGFFVGETDAGLYAQKLDATLDLRTAGVGFRCVQDVQF